ncbi:hypothetical protein [Streptomyces sp. NPDC088733]|uniref:hypothetical protein n=1 Tax=Streptomyces sp. NPDC088733 TaxID=3365880 RepID=UPI00381E2F9A
MEGWKFWWGIAAFFLGGLSTQFSGWLTYRRQRMDKAVEDADALKKRREEFELQHLIETNEKLHVLRQRLWDFTLEARKVRASNQADGHQDQAGLTAARDAMDAAEGALHGNVGFILNDEIRLKVQEAIQAIGGATFEVLGGSPVPHFEMNKAVAEAFDALSARVRAIYANQPNH